MTEENFYKNRSSQDGYFPNCRKCNIKKTSQYQREHTEERSAYNRKQYKEKPEYFKEKRERWHKNNKEYHKQLLREWQKVNPDKCIQYSKEHNNHTITKEEWESCKRFFNNSCATCGKTIEKQRKEHKQDLHKDHVIHEGRNDLKNCIPLCKNCNTSKHQKSFNNWYNPENPIYNFDNYHRIYLWIRYEAKKHIKKKRDKKQESA